MNWEYWSSLDKSTKYLIVSLFILWLGILSISLAMIFTEFISMDTVQVFVVISIVYLYLFLIVVFHPNHYKLELKTRRIFEVLGFGESGKWRSLLLWCSFISIPLFLWLATPDLLYFWFTDKIVIASMLIILVLYLAGGRLSELTNSLLEDATEEISWVQIFDDKTTWVEEKSNLEGGISHRKGIVIIVVLIIANLGAYWINTVIGFRAIYGLPLNTPSFLSIAAATVSTYLFWTLLFISLISIFSSNNDVFWAFAEALSDVKKLKILKFLESVEKWVSKDCPDDDEMKEVLDLLEPGTNHYGVYLRVSFIRNRLLLLFAILLLAAIFPLMTWVSEPQPITMIMMIIGLIGPYVVAFSFLSVELIIHRVLTMSKRAFLDFFSLLYQREIIRYLGDEGRTKRLEFLRNMIDFSEKLPVWTFNYGTFAAWGVSVILAPVIQFAGTIILSTIGII